MNYFFMILSNFIVKFKKFEMQKLSNDDRLSLCGPNFELLTPKNSQEKYIYLFQKNLLIS